MVNFPIDTNIFKIADKITTPIARDIDEEWFTEDITVLTSNEFRGSTIINDFAYNVSSIIEYTLDGRTTWIPFNEGVEVTGGQSRYIRITTGVQLNFRAKTAGTLIRSVVGEV